MTYIKPTKTGRKEIRHAFDPHLSGENVTAETKVLGKFYFEHGKKNIYREEEICIADHYCIRLYSYFQIQNEIAPIYPIALAGEPPTKNILNILL
jgi:hypothetical protein